MKVASLVQQKQDGLYYREGDFYNDPGGPVRRAVIAHAHGDHARLGAGSYLCAVASASLLLRRFGTGGVIESKPYGETVTIGDVRVSFHPAGHILGSAQVRVAGESGVWVVAGAHKRQPAPPCPPFEPVRCDTFITESTFGPIFRWITRTGDCRRAGVVDENREAGPRVRAFERDRQGAARWRNWVASPSACSRPWRHAPFSTSIAPQARMLDASAVIERARGTCAGG